MEAFRWFRTVVTEHYSDFGGRARRAEFWWYLAVFAGIDVVLALVQHPMHTKFLTAFFGLGLFAPTVGVEVRRLHDVGRSGWWLLIGCVPIVGGLVLLYWFVQPGVAGANAFGPDPKQLASGGAAAQERR